MKKIFSSIILLFSFVLNAQMMMKGKVVAVLDGDTIIVLADNTQTKIRLAEIDCPEKGQSFGMKAKMFTSDAVYSQIVEYESISIDRYGRTVAKVYYGPDKKYLSAELVRNGLAWHYKKYSDSRELHLLELNAKRNKRGLWSEKQISPEEFRRTPKSNQLFKINVHTTMKKKRHSDFVKIININ